MATATIMFSPWFTGTDDDNNPLESGLLRIYDAGTSDPATVWQDADRVATHAFPIVLDGAGRAVVFLDPTKSYKVRLENSAGVLQKEVDLLAATPLNSSATVSVGTAGETIAAEALLYLSDGSGGLTAGRWYKADADQTYSSTLPLLGIAVTAAASAGDPLSVNLAGMQEMAGPLTPGVDYFVSATAGQITSVPPANERFVGWAHSATELAFFANPPIAPSAATGYVYQGTGSGSRPAFDKIKQSTEIQAYQESKTSPAIAANVLTLDLSLSSFFTVALNAAINTLTITNPPAGTKVGSFTLIFTADGTPRAVTWGASVLWPGGVAPTLTSTNNKRDMFTFVSTDGGATWLGLIVGQNF